jgi:hypothetical protein
MPPTGHGSRPTAPDRPRATRPTIQLVSLDDAPRPAQRGVGAWGRGACPHPSQWGDIGDDDPDAQHDSHARRARHGLCSLLLLFPTALPLTLSLTPYYIGGESERK